MPRPRRRIEAGAIYHVLNRGNGRRMLFTKDGDFAAFLTLLGDAVARFPVDLLGYCLMGNHWHLLLRPRAADALPRFMAWLTVTHARRHHRHYPNPGTGHLYQGRFKSFPVQSDAHFLTVACYIHANPLRAGLVERAQDWAWSDLSARAELPIVAEWPVDRPRNWTALVNASAREAISPALAQSLRRGSPFGAPEWIERTAVRMNLRGTLRERGRPVRPIDSVSPRQQRRRAKRGHKST